jgi:hypothetical protein
MSHIVRIKTEIRDGEALAIACRRLGLEQPEVGTANLFSGEARGHIVRLPGWRYPIVVELSSGQIQYDNYEGRWGDGRELDRVRQAYAVEKTRLEARKAGYSVAEQLLGDGSIKLTLQQGGVS